MKHLLLTAAAVAAVAAGSAASAQTTRDWSGGYVGAQMGWGQRANADGERLGFDTNLDGQFNDTVRTGAGADAFSPGSCDGIARGAARGAGCTGDKDSNFEFGARAGYDWQFGNWVVGGVAEVTRLNLDDDVTSFSTTPAFYTFSRELNGWGALRARAGYAMGDNLLYATGGVARAEMRDRFTTSNRANTFTVTNDDKWVNGYQVGGGYERKLTDDVSLGVEYLYSNFDNEGATARAGGPAPAGNPFLLVNSAGTDMRRSKDLTQLHSVRMTASYRF